MARSLVVAGIFALAAVFLPGGASAQGVTRICLTINALGSCEDIGANFPLPVTVIGGTTPAGSATSANQTAVQSAPGTSAGTAEGVQGVAGGVPVTVTPYSPVAGKQTSTNITLAANTNTTIAANANRIGHRVQCDGTAVVALSEIGTAITGVSLTTTGVTILIPATANAVWIPDYSTQTAIVFRSAGTPSCVVTETSK